MQICAEMWHKVEFPGSQTLNCVYTDGARSGKLTGLQLTPKTCFLEYKRDICTRYVRVELYNKLVKLLFQKIYLFVFGSRSSSQITSLVTGRASGYL